MCPPVHARVSMHAQPGTEARDRTCSPRTANVSFSFSFSFFAVPPRSLHHRLDGRLRSPRSTQVLSNRSLGLLNFASDVWTCPVWRTAPHEARAMT
jgi:hypothetical protein